MQTHRPVTKPTKQRKMIYQAPDHVRHKLLAAHLSPELRASHLIRSLPVRTGDTVRVMRGDHKSVEGKITRVDLKKYRIYVEGLTREKVDGTTIFVPIHASKVMITRLNLDDKWRKEILETKLKAKKPKRTEEKPKRAKKPEEKLVEIEEPKKVVEEKPPEAVEEVKEIVEEKPAKKEKAPKKEVAKAKKPTRKKTAEKTKTKTKAEEAEKEEQPKERKPRRTTKKTAKKTVEEEE
jgi:large subunit ribosomal protein L24